MRKLVHYISDHLSCCLNCGSLWITGQGLCMACLDKLKTKEKPKTFFAEDMKVAALFPWTPSESDLLSYWLLSLKGGGQQRIWKHWAHHLVVEKLNAVPRHCVVVPAPPSKPGEKDHAYEWAFALAQALGADFAPCLKKNRIPIAKTGILRGTAGGRVWDY
jgi:predicted amidophosphoribosyltransferase